ncbi:prolyl oligopeptidase family serine peptidase [Sphaerisporangium sp. NPDC051017]|uniref:S9 family peptidase n=1 Tax=Sphaerisporangium sp. NPDC051017 TaxID=3154636 RepID=UPI00344A98A6
MTLAKLIDVEEFFADPEFSGASISPDGTRIAYLAPAHGRLNVWVRGLDEGHEDAVCVTRDARRGIKMYYWTEDPRWLLYLQDTDGNEDWHLYRVDLEAPETPAVDLTPLPLGSGVLGVEPMRSRPGTVLVTMNRRPRFVDAFRIDIATGETTLHRESPVMTSSFFFGPDGEAFLTAMADDGTWEFFAIDDATGQQKLIRRCPGPEHPLGVFPVEVTADGKGLLLGVYHDSDELSLVRVDGETGAETVVAALPGHSLCTAAIGPPTLFRSRRTGEVLAARFVGDRPIVHVVDPHFAEVYAELSKLSDGVLASVSSDESERRWVATFFHDREPDLTYLYDHGTRESRLLFRPYPRLDPADLAPTRAVSLTARDGLPLPAFLTLPVGVDPVGLPLVLVVHGGPWAHDAWANYAALRVQFLANRGYAVLQVNFRGSSGYGKRHITAAIGEFAGAMHDDLIDAADWAVKQGIADPARIGIYGGSYGGYSALVGVTVTPDYFAAAVDYCGISSLPNFMRTVPELWYSTIMKNSFLLYCGDPGDPDQEADLLARSPITMIDRVRTPLLVAQGANDVRVVKEESDNVVDALRARGVPVEYLVADDEGHGFQNPENVVTLFRAIERHFAEHLGGRSA